MTTLTIDLQAISALGSVDDALGDFYTQQIGAVARRTGAREREIRAWIEGELISEEGFRTQVLEGPGHAGSEVLRELQNAHLIRSDSRRNARWYELAHDRLVEPIRKANKAWRAEHLSPLQMKANEWDGLSRPSGLLIAGDVLAEAEAWADAHADELLPVENEYLDACRESVRQALVLERSSRRNKILAMAAALLAAAAGIGLVIALIAQRSADRQRDAARAAEAIAEEERGRAVTAAENEAGARARADAETERARVAEDAAELALEQETAARARADAETERARVAEDAAELALEQETTARLQADFESERARVAEEAATMALDSEAEARAAAERSAAEAELQRDAARQAQLLAEESQTEVVSALRVIAEEIFAAVCTQEIREEEPCLIPPAVVVRVLRLERAPSCDALETRNIRSRLDNLTPWQFFSLVNETGEPIHVFWISPNRLQIMWDTVQDGEVSDDIQTVNGWVWVVKDTSGECLMAVAPPDIGP